MNGYVSDDGTEAVIELNLRGSRGVGQQIEAVIDTGFTSTLILPPEVVDRLDPPVARSAEFELADGRVETVPGYQIGLIWHGRSRTVRAYETGHGSPLVGMGMLAGSRLEIEAVAGGLVNVEELATPR